MLMSVSTRTLPRAGIVVSLAAYRSYPAAKALPRVGSFALSESFLIRSAGAGSMADTSVAAALCVVVVLLGISASAAAVVASVLTRFAGGENFGDVGGSGTEVMFFLFGSQGDLSWAEPNVQWAFIAVTAVRARRVKWQGHELANERA
jgi:hypothetical protein